MARISSASDERYMRMALALARKGLGHTHPNPPVGAVIVKGRRIVGAGYHKRAGGDHAEIAALKKAGKRAEGATIYVTLEPCAHHGKTPPCVDAVIHSGIKRAVIGTVDPNPMVAGRGIKALKHASVITAVGIMRKEADNLIRHFKKFITAKMPYVTLKMAQTLDGKIADSKGRSKWISSKESRAYVHRLRAENDAVMIGVGTFIKDNPLLTNRVHKGGSKKNPIRVIVDTHLSSPLTHKIWGDRTGGPIIIAAGGSVSMRKRRLFEEKGARVITIGENKRGLDLRALMRALSYSGITSILAEGGGELAFSLIRDKLVDEAVIFISSRILGGRKAPTSFEGEGFSTIAAASWLKDTVVENVGSDIVVKGKL